MRYIKILVAGIILSTSFTSCNKENQYIGNYSGTATVTTTTNGQTNTNTVPVSASITYTNKTLAYNGTALEGKKGTYSYSTLMQGNSVTVQVVFPDASTMNTNYSTTTQGITVTYAASMKK